METLKSILLTYSFEMLDCYLEFLDIKKVVLSKEELVYLIEYKIKKNILTYYNTLNDLQQNCVKECLYSKNHLFDKEFFIQKYGELPQFKYKNKPISYLSLFIYNEKVIPFDLVEILKKHIEKPVDKIECEMIDSINDAKICNLDILFKNNLLVFYQIIEFDNVTINLNSFKISKNPAELLNNYIKDVCFCEKSNIIDKYLNILTENNIITILSNQITVLNCNFFDEFQTFWTSLINIEIRKQYNFINYIKNQKIIDWILLKDFERISNNKAENNNLVIYGLFDIAITENKFVYLKLNKLGRYFIFNENYNFNNEKTITILPNTEIITTQNTPDFIIYFLEKICENISLNLYKLDLKSVLKLLNTGKKSEDILNFIENNSENKIPSIIYRYFEDIKSKTLKITTKYIVIEAQNEIIAKIISNDKKLKNYCKFSENNKIMIDENDEVEFKKALLKNGYVLQ